MSVLTPRTRQPRRRSAPARLLLAAGGAAVAVVLGILAGGGTFAAWNAGASAASAATLRAGSASISVTPLALSADGLYPGRTVYAASTVRNTGTTPLAIGLATVGATTATPFSSAVVISAAQAGSTADCTVGRTAQAVTATAGTSPAAPLGTLAPGARMLLCIGLGLRTDAPAAAAGGTPTGITLTLSAAQVRS